MSVFSRLQAAARQLPLFERPADADDRQRAPDQQVLERLATSLDADETIIWAGWVFAGRGISPVETLPDAAAVVTDRRVVWCSSEVVPRVDHELIDDLVPLRLDRSTKRLLLRTEERDETHPELAVIWSFDMEPLIAAIANQGPARTDPT